MRNEQNPSRKGVIEPEQPLSVDEIYKLIYQNEANENPIERHRKDDELYALLDLAEEMEAKRS